MAIINLAAAGNAENNKNLINPRFQAEALRRIRGYDCGILENSFYSTADATGIGRTGNSNFMWPLTATNVQNITVGRGMATAYGYDIQSESDISLTATAPSSGTKYVFIYLEWDLSNPVEAVGSLLIHDNGSSSSWTPPNQDNLITNPIGKYQMILYRLTINTSGGVTAATSWGTFGVLTVGNPLRARYADSAENAGHADTADRADDYNTTSGRIKSKFDDIETRLVSLGFRTGTISGGTSSSLTKLGNYVVGYLTFNCGNSHVADIPDGFRPYSTKTTAICIRGYDTTGRVYTYAPGILTFNTNGSVIASAASNFDDSKTVVFGWDTTVGNY